MSEQKNPYTVSQEKRTAIHDLVDKVMQAEGAKGVMVLCCSFTQDDTQAMTCAACATGIMSMDDVIRGIARCGGHLLRQIEQRTEQQCAETPASEMRQ